MVVRSSPKSTGNGNFSPKIPSRRQFYTKVALRMSTISAEQIEQAIEFAAPGQAELFLDFEWLVPMVDGRFCAVLGEPPFVTHYIFTAHERFEPLQRENQRGKEYESNPYPLMSPDGWMTVKPMSHQSVLERCELVPTPGRELFQQIAEVGDYHTVSINSGCARYDEGRKNGVVQMPSGWTALLMRGIDPMPEARILPARSIAEIHLAMRQLHLVSELTHRLEYVGEELAAVYEGLNQHQKLVRQAFTLVKPMQNSEDLGDGASQILCGALLAYFADSHLWDIHNNFHPTTRRGRWEATPQMLRELEEVIKMLAPATDQLPPACFRKEGCVSFVRHKAYMLQGAWLRATRQKFVEFYRDYPSEAPR